MPERPRVHAVVAPAPGADRSRAGVEARRRLARAALRAAAARCGPSAAEPFAPAVDGSGAPLPHRGRHWSLAHTRGLCTAAVATGPAGPVGIDVEWLGRGRPAAFEERLDDAQRALLPDGGAGSLIALWTAFEAVLKLTGEGLAGLPHCRLAGVADDGAWLVAHRGRTRRVRQRRLGEHVLSLACDAPDGYRLEWSELAPDLEIAP